MRHAAALLLCLCALLASCNQQAQEQIQPQAGTISDGKYHYSPLGWSMPLPWRWNVLTPKELQAVLGKGRNLMEKATGGEVIDTETHLLYLDYDATSKFTSSVSPHDESLGSEPEQADATFDMVLAAYKAGKYRLRSRRGSETVGGIRFDHMQVSILDPKGRREIVQQHVYLGRVGPNWLTVSISTTSWIPRQQMMFAWRGSRFSTPREGD